MVEQDRGQRRGKPQSLAEERLQRLLAVRGLGHSGFLIRALDPGSSISEPANGSSVSADDEEVTVKGYAWSGDGRGISCVDVSPEGGNTWHVLELEGEQQKPERAWA